MEYKTGTIVFGEWEIKKLLGEGGYGKVFEIEKTNYGITTRSALKVIRVPGSPSEVKEALSEGMDERSVTTYFRGFVNEIIKEIVVMTSLKSHPGIVGYEDHEVIEHEGSIGWDILIRMELLTPVMDYQISHVMDEETVIRMAKDVAEVLMYCQQKGLVHRDIKPENIFVSDFGKFKLGDFGVARTLEKTTGGLSKKGTESYMAPEVYQGKSYNSSVDIYSLGLVLYRYMNHNRLPFFPPMPQPITYSDREKAIYYRMRGEQMAPPVNASKEFAQIILKACAYRPEDRYHSAQELLDALNQLQIQEKTGESEEDDGGENGDGGKREKKSKKGYGKYILAGAAVVLAVTAAGALLSKPDPVPEQETNIQVSEVTDEVLQEETENLPEETEIIPEEEIVLQSDAYYETILMQIMEETAVAGIAVDGIDLNTLTLQEFADVLEPYVIKDSLHVEESEDRMFAATNTWYVNAYDEGKENVSSIILTQSDETWDEEALEELKSLLYFKESEIRLGDTREEVYEKLGITQDMLVWLRENTRLGENNYMDYEWENDGSYYSVSFDEAEYTLKDPSNSKPELKIEKNGFGYIEFIFYDGRFGEFFVNNYQ